MTSRGFATKAAARTPLGGNGRLPVSPVGPAIDALERGIRRRSRRIVSPELGGRACCRSGCSSSDWSSSRYAAGSRKTLEIARGERPPLTTPQPAREKQAR